MSQSYRTLVVDESILAGNCALLKCLVPSFVTDFVSVTSWLEETQAQEMFPHAHIGSHALVSTQPNFHNSYIMRKTVVLYSKVYLFCLFVCIVATTLCPVSGASHILPSIRGQPHSAQYQGPATLGPVSGATVSGGAINQPIYTSFAQGISIECKPYILLW